MSSNDYILIRKIGNADWRVSHNDADTDSEISFIGQTDDLEKANDLAIKYEEELDFGVEYGVRISKI